MKTYIALIRPQHWIKNAFVFVPAFFAAKISLVYSDLALVLAFASFCLTASAVYIFNDLFDLKHDRLHEVKRNRPLALGEISKSNSVVLMVCLVMSGGILGSFVGGDFLGVIGIYVAINIAYSVYWKRFSLIDISLIASGFVLRVIGGGLAADVPVSKWLILMTFLLACCLALGKRRDDLLLDVDKNQLRPALSGYTLPFIDTCLIVLGVTTIVCYIMYTVSEEVVDRLRSDSIYISSIFVILGILRFLQIAIVEERSGSPTLILLKDRMMQFVVALWLLFFLLILYVS